MTQPYPPQRPQSPPPPQTKKRRWPWVVGGILLLFVVLGIANSGNGQTTQNRPGTPSGVDTNTWNAQPRTIPTAQPSPPPAQSGPQTTFGPGTYEVGVDIQPGKYKTQGGGFGGSCYWARLKNTDGDLTSIIANGNTQGPATITIKAGDGAFETTCETWTKAG